MHIAHELRRQVEHVERHRARFIGLRRDEAQRLGDELGIKVRFMDGSPVSADLRPQRLGLRCNEQGTVIATLRG